MNNNKHKPLTLTSIPFNMTQEQVDKDLDLFTLFLIHTNSHHLSYTITTLLRLRNSNPYFRKKARSLNKHKDKQKNFHQEN